MSVQSLVLRHGEVEQQLCFATAGAMPAEEFLSESVKKQAAAFKFAAKREGFLLGRLPPSAHSPRCSRNQTCGRSKFAPAFMANRSSGIPAPPMPR